MWTPNENKILNKGLIFKVLGVKDYKTTEEGYKQFGQTYENVSVIIDYKKDDDGKPNLNSPITKKYTIINAKAIESEGNITGIDATTEEVNMTGSESLKLENGTLSYYNSKNEFKEETV